MKIILIAPQTTTRHRYDMESFRFDYAYWNFYLPLLSLGHSVEFFDSSFLEDKDLERMIRDFKPDMLFCIMTGSQVTCPNEPWSTVRRATKKGDIKTFNWFCDDSWRFEGFSAEVCTSFHYCSTPEKRFVKRYKEIGYDNIVYATWHANSDLYSSMPSEERRHLFGFVGAVHAGNTNTGWSLDMKKDLYPGNPGSRATYLNHLRSNNFDVFIPEDTSFEDMLWAYSSSFAGLSFSQNSTNTNTQMKARMFEVPATGALLVTEYTEDLENCYEIDKEIVVFRNKEELFDIAKDIKKNRELYKLIANNGARAFRGRHESKIRLKKLLEDIK